MALEEIDKLRLRVEKDPTSRLFLPLAEEYRKAGMPDEAISVLSKGLERHPGYTSARVAIGRLYLEKNMLQDARAEFERVVSVAPDNLFAHRKLADIYRDLGENERAAAEYKTLLVLNPIDEDARACLDVVESRLLEEHAAAVYPEDETGMEVTLEEGVEAESGEDVFLDVYTGEETLDAEMVELTESRGLEEDFEEFSKSLSQEVEIGEAPVETAEDSSKETAASQAGRAFQNVAQDTGAGEGSAEVAFAINVSTADSLIATGNYSRAMEAYRGMLARDPGNRGLLQRVAELKAFLKLIGRGEEILISKLEGFREGINRRFSRSH